MGSTMHIQNKGYKEKKLLYVTSLVVGLFLSHITVFCLIFSDPLSKCRPILFLVLLLEMTEKRHFRNLHP